MDTMRGNFGSLADAGGYDPADDDDAAHSAPSSIGQDERRMQVRAYNHWASLLEDRNYPAIEDLEPESLPDFGPYSVLLDFSTGIENPGICYLGEKLAEECGVGEDELTALAQVPQLSLLTRITDHYMQILANQAPIGFEAEFVNQRGATVAYRGILLPFSSDDDTIDFIYGVINWKELADAQHSDELLLEIDQALQPQTKTMAAATTPLTDWADGPGANPVHEHDEATGMDIGIAGEAPDALAFDMDEEGEEDSLPLPSFGMDDEDEESGPGPVFGSLLKLPIQTSKTPLDLSGKPFSEELETSEDGYDLDLPQLDRSTMNLSDWLAAAREVAVAAGNSEDRTRAALYEAIGRAYDFSLAAAVAPAEFEELLADSGLKRQSRAPMTPVVKLVFGADYDKTRLTEYAAALAHAHRLALPQGALGEFLRQAEGGLKGVVKTERRLRKEEAGKTVEPASKVRGTLARKLRELPPQRFEALRTDGDEFSLVVIRRIAGEDVVVLGEVSENAALVERAARQLIG